MSLVTRGLSSPDALLPTFGLGIGASVVIVVPVEQLASLKEILIASGLSEIELDISLEDRGQQVALVEFVIVGEAADVETQVAVIENVLINEAVEYEITTDITESIK